MKKYGEPEILHVGQEANSAVITFRDGGPFYFSATLLYAARDIAQLMHEKELEASRGDLAP